jgi:hypothetical protein
MRIVTLVLVAGLLLTAAPLLAPTASACDPNVPGTCVKCVYGYTSDCIVRNPCDPRSCDPYWP